MRRRLPVLLAALAVCAVATGSLHAWVAYTTARWPGSATMTLNRSSVANVSASQAAAAIQTAMSAWNNAGAKMTLSLSGGDTNVNQLANDGVSAIFFRQDSSGSAIATTYTWWDGNNRMIDSDIVFWNGGRVFFAGSSGCSSGYYIEDIAAHELGHVIGLDHSYFVDANGQTATMYPTTGWCDQNFRTLSSDDIDGVRSLYGVGSTKTSSGGSTNTSPDGTTVPGAAQIVDNLGAVWTIAANTAILRNGLQAAYGWGKTILWTSNTIYVQGFDNGWWQWAGSGWVYVGFQKPGDTSLTTSPDGTTVPGATQIVDGLGAVWTIGANAAILRNGLQAAYGWGKTILWTSNTIYVQGFDDNWWQWTGSGWVRV